MVNLELYKIFKIVADERSITRASEKLYISQPAVTQHIQNLEKALGIKLFNRSNSGLTLTENGTKIYQDINKAITELESIEKKCKVIKNINLGSHIIILSELFSKNLGKYYELYPDVKICTVNEDIDEMLLKLEKQELDIVISKKVIDFENEQIKFIKKGEIHDILVVNPFSDLLNKKVSIEDLKKQEIYMPRKTSVTCTNFFKALNVSEKDFKSIRNISYHSMVGIVATTKYVGLVTKEFVKDALENKKVVELNTDFEIPSLEYGIYVNKNNKMKELKELVELL